jgi:hypothetical protein
MTQDESDEPEPGLSRKMIIRVTTWSEMAKGYKEEEEEEDDDDDDGEHDNNNPFHQSFQ